MSSSGGGEKKLSRAVLLDYGQASIRLARTAAGTVRNVPTGSDSAVVEHPSRYYLYGED